MGMDVYGQSPETEAGEYFRASVWGWHPLWNLCEDKFRTVASKVEYGHSNDGDGLSADDAKALSRMINSSIENGTIQDWIDQDNARKDALPRKACHCCKGEGIRWDEVGTRAGQPSRELDPTVAVIVGRTHGWCNGCGGLGDQEHHEAGYRIDVEFVQEWADFLIDCGGFKIY